MPDNKFIEGDPRGDDLSGADSWVAKNPSTPPEVLTELAHDEEWYIRVIPAHNPSTPSEVLAKLAEHEAAYWEARGEPDRAHSASQGVWRVAGIAPEPPPPPEVDQLQM